jgi:cell division protein ZapE
MTSSGKSSPRERYAADLQRADFSADAAQAAAIDALQKTYETLLASPPKRFLGRRRLPWPAVPAFTCGAVSAAAKPI